MKPIKAQAEFITVGYRCETCGVKGEAKLPASSDVYERMAGARQHHDVYRVGDCTEWKPRWNQGSDDIS